MDMTSTMGFRAKLAAAEAGQGMLCVGLDPDPDRFGGALAGRPEMTFEFCREIVDATADLVCAFKPQIAYFAALGAEGQLEKLCEHIRARHPHVVLILDAKRGDIGSTAEQYAVEAFDRYGVTVNPYLGRDSLEPFLDRDDRGAFVLCRTSNPGSDAFQSLDVSGRPLYEHVAATVTGEWDPHGRTGLVVGATQLAELARVRALVGPDVPLLVPGVGAQGASAAEATRAGGGRALVINSSRAVLYASSGDDFATAARGVATSTASEIYAYAS
jgi:orotidine-5'-phosphate decarboxylase